jgi:outer membrane protein
MKKRILFFSLMLLIVSAVMAQKQWTLQECLDYAMANNITLKKQQLRQQTAMEELKGAKGALLPSVTASTNQSLGYQPWKDSGISTVTNAAMMLEGIYSPSGLRLQQLQRGLNIVISNGKARKVLVK